MKKLILLLLLAIFLTLAAISCGPSTPAAPVSQEEIELLQEGNGLPKTQLPTRPLPPQLTDNNIGADVGNWELLAGYETKLYEGLLHAIRGLGVKWVRTNFWSPNPLNWQEVLQEPGVYSIPEDCDDFITELANDGMNIVLTLSAGAGLDSQQYDWWGGSGWGVLGDREPEWWFDSQEDHDRFIDYVSFMVEHFRGRVKYYEIWNEPNCGENPGDSRGGITLDDYVSLIKQVAPVIRQIDPEAKIIAGAVGGFTHDNRLWLQQMLSQGVAPLVDAISWHPFYGDSPLTDTGDYPRHPESSYWEDYASNVENFKLEVASSGFQGDFMVEEMVWRTPNDLTSETPLYTDITAAKYAARANIIHLSLNFTMVSNQMLMPGKIKLLPRYYVVKNLCRVMTGAEPASLPVDIDSKADNIRSYAFSLSNGDKLLALWTDGVAVDGDAGVRTTLTFPGFSAQKVMAIDVLNGFEQEMITSVEDGDLVIENLMVKDYPIILRFTP